MRVRHEAGQPTRIASNPTDHIGRVSSDSGIPPIQHTECKHCSGRGIDVGAVEKVPTEKTKAKSKQRKERGTEASGSAWACAACTLQNAPGATVCSACEAPAPRQPQAQSWSCDACTLANDEKDARCRACGHGRPKKRCAPAIPFFDDDDDFVS